MLTLFWVVGNVALRHVGGMTEDEEIIAPANERQTSEWITVLSALNLDYRLTYEGAAWVMHVPVAQASRARAELEAYEREGRLWSGGQDAFEDALTAGERSGSPLWAAGFLLVFYLWLGAYDGGVVLLRAAAADSTAMAAGEWWRAVTALTIHADEGHLVGNMVSLALFGYAACLAYGGGLAWALILASGITGNALAAVVSGPDHISVGASTACFGALGILVAHQLVENVRRFGFTRSVWSRTWIPLGAGCGLLALLGTGPRSDLAAHATGFLCGVVLALPFSWVQPDRVPRWLQAALQLGCIVVVMMAWRAAGQ